MGHTADALLSYLKDVIYNPSRAALDIDKLDEEFRAFGKGLVYLADSVAEANRFASALAKGDLSSEPPPRKNELASSLKSLHASLKHLTWQTQQVAVGDYNQRVDFMGEFSAAFNTMTRQLAERQQTLEKEIEVNVQKSIALERSYRLLTDVTQSIPQPIVVINRRTSDVLFMNGAAKAEVVADPAFMDMLMQKVPELSPDQSHVSVTIQHGYGDAERYFSVNSYLIEWYDIVAEAFVVTDISLQKRQIKELEAVAYQDQMTGVYSRFYGMRLFRQWMEEKRAFALVFVDLDNLKFINDRFGHAEGDTYIINSAHIMREFSTDTLVCRLGGDEFMLLAPGFCFDSATERMIQISVMLSECEYLADKDYEYSVSFGIVGISGSGDENVTDVLSRADERMYEHKRARKKERQR